MGKPKIAQLNQDSTKMLSEKTNEDFNKKKPDPKDPNEIKSSVTDPPLNIVYDKQKFKHAEKFYKIYYGEENYENDEK